MKIAMVQMDHIIGDLKYNATKHLQILAEYGNNVDLIVFSELSVTGYYPFDLLDMPSFITAQEKVCREITDATASITAAVILGKASSNQFTGKPLHNEIVLLKNGSVYYEYSKRLLPAYNIFDEARHFEPGQMPGIFVHNGIKIGVLICEDIWTTSHSTEYRVDPVAELSREKPDFVLSINASPSNVQKLEQRHDVVGQAARRMNAPVVYVNQIGGHDEIVFDGASFVCDSSGQIQHQLPAFEEAVGVISIIDKKLTFPAKPTISEPFHLQKFNLRQIITGLKAYITKLNFPGVVVGCSGGIDSALTLALAVEALGADQVKAITMPSPLSSSGSVDDSIALCENLGIEMFCVNISEEYELDLKRFEQTFNKKPSSLTTENMQARIRGRILMEYSNDSGHIVLSTGNKSEASVGYFTLYGDSCGGLNLIGDLYKMEVYALSKYINSQHRTAVIPLPIIEKEPSAELAPGQRDSDSLPEYPILDAILKLHLEGDLLPTTERLEAVHLLRNTSKDIIAEIIKKVSTNEFKRRQTPPIIRLKRRSFGRGRQLPIVANFDHGSFLEGMQ